MKNLIFIAAVAALTCTAAFAGEKDQKAPGWSDGMFSVVINEDGAPTLNGVALTGNVGADGNMAWNLGQHVTPGDVLLNEPGQDGKPGILSDVLRFNPILGCDWADTMTFYSDGEQDDSAADLGLPSHLLNNQACVIEPSSENVLYTAGCNTYNITSDSAPGTSPVPEPSSFAFLATAGLPLAGLLRRKS